MTHFGVIVEIKSIIRHVFGEKPRCNREGFSESLPPSKTWTATYLQEHPKLKIVDLCEELMKNGTFTNERNRWMYSDTFDLEEEELS